MTSLTLVRRIAARPSVVFDALSTANGVASWWGPDDLPVLKAQMDPRVGGEYRVRFRTQDGREHEVFGEFLEMTPPSRLVMTWCWTDGGEFAEAGGVSRIEMDLRPIDGGTELTFTHADLRNEASRASHEGGWAGAFDKLTRRLGELPSPA